MSGLCRCQQFEVLSNSLFNAPYALNATHSKLLRGCVSVGRDLKSSLCVGIDIDTNLDFKARCSETGACPPTSAEKIIDMYGQSSPPAVWDKSKATASLAEESVSTKQYNMSSLLTKRRVLFFRFAVRA
jgi:hypothetical protein